MELTKGEAVDALNFVLTYARRHKTELQAKKRLGYSEKWERAILPQNIIRVEQIIEYINKRGLEV